MFSLRERNPTNAGVWCALRTATHGAAVVSLILCAYVARSGYLNMALSEYYIQSRIRKQDRQLRRSQSV